MDSRSVKTVSGIVSASSDIIKVHLGKVAFLELSTENGISKALTILLLMKEALDILKTISHGSLVTLVSPKRFRWKLPVGGVECGNNNIDSNEIYYLVDNRAALKVQPPQTVSSVLSGDSLHIFYSCGGLRKEELVRQEVSMEGTVGSLHPMGWLELRLEKNTRNDSVTVFVYCAGSDKNSSIGEARCGDVVRVRNVLPVYLWGGLRGFAYGVRSSLEVVRRSDPRAAGAGDCWLRACPRVKARCGLYSAWVAESLRRLSSALLPELSPDTGSAVCVKVRSVLEADCALLAGGELLAPVEVGVQEEFRSADHAQLFRVRAGLDADYLGERLPQVWTCSALRRRVEGFVRRKIAAVGVCERQDFATHCWDPVQAVADSQGPLNVHLVASIVCVEMPQRTLDCARRCSGSSSLAARLMDSEGCVVDLTVRCAGQDYCRAVASQISAGHSHLPFNGGHHEDWLQRTTVSGAALRPGATAIISGPLCCVVEEHPLHDERSCVLHLVVEQDQVRWICPSAPSDSILRICGYPGDSMLRSSAAPDVPLTNGAWPQRATLGPSVRDLLQTDLLSGGPGSATARGQRAVSVVGVVVSKQIMMNAFRNQPDRHQQKKGRHSSSQPSEAPCDKRCKVVLRDCRHADTIAAYMSLPQSAALVAGMVARLTGCALSLPESRKKPYIRVDDLRAGAAPNKSRIEVLGFCDVNHLRALCTGVTSESPRGVTAVGVAVPPTSSVAALAGTCHFDRCFWTIVGRVTFVRKVAATLRCRRCMCVAAVPHSGGALRARCLRCDSSSGLYALWEAVVAFDDGSGECDLHAEGPDALRLIGARHDPSSHRLTVVVAGVERVLLETGRFVHDAAAAMCGRLRFATTSDAAIGGVAFNSESLLDEAAALDPPTAILNATPSGAPLSGAHSALAEYLQHCSFATQFSVVCCVDTFAQGMHGSPAEAPVITGRRVSLQEVNRGFAQHRAQFSPVPTTARRKLCLDAHRVTRLTGDGLRLGAWELMESL